MSKHEDPFLNYFFVPLYVADTKWSFMPMTLVSAMTLGNSFHFIPYFRVLLATNVGSPQFGFGFLALCQKLKTKKPQPTTTLKESVGGIFFLVLLGLAENGRVFQSLGLFLYNGRIFFFFFLLLNMAMLEPEDRSLNCSLLSSVETVKYLTVTIPVAG